MRVGYCLVYVPDVAATLAFYESAFGLKRSFMTPEEDYAQLDTGSVTVAFASETLARSNLNEDFAKMRPDQPPPPFELALVADDVHARFADALAAGAVEAAPVKTKPWGQQVGYVKDLNGCLVEICSPMPAS